MKEIKYDIVRSPTRKKLTISVERDRRVVVHAPEGTSDEVVHQIVDAKRQWVLSKLSHSQKYQDRAHPPGKEVVSGESAPFLGKDYRIELGETESGQVEFAESFKVPPAYEAKRREVLKEWYIAQAKERILPRVAERGRELGVAFKSAKIVDNRYRWGSCTAEDSVTYNWRLVKAPMFVIDYVIVHELAHLMEGNHTSAFWNIVRANSPKMEKAKVWLIEHGQMLEQEV